MAKELLTPEESDLRRRARRRLVGAIALALVAVVVLPMLFNPEPKPLGSDVDIRIPDQDTPFEPGVPAAPTPEQTSPPTAELARPPAVPAVTPTPPHVTAKPAAPSKAEASPVEGSVSAAPKTAAAGEAAPRPGTSKSAGGQADKPSAPASEGFAARGYFLQLGSFTSEANAHQLAEKARTAGFRVTVQSVGGQVRVRMGPYRDRKEALEMQARLRAKGFGPVLLGP